MRGRCERHVQWQEKHVWTERERNQETTVIHAVQTTAGQTSVKKQRGLVIWYVAELLLLV